MASQFKREIPFLKVRNIMFIISAILIALSIVGIVSKGLNFGIEFSGGTSIDFKGTGSVTTEQMREAFNKQGQTDTVIQTTSSDSQAGFLVRTTEIDPNKAAQSAAAIAQDLKLADDSYTVTTIGPGWGADVSKSSLIAFLVAIGLIIAWISIRFEFKMSLTGISSLFHDLIILTGVYAWTGFEITPNVIAALLTIMGYSLYDTVVVFHRINENSKDESFKTGKTFMQIANTSLNEVFVRTINTTITSLVPVLAMLFFGGETLKDFAFAMSLGLVLGSYSSIGIATPLFALWKGIEPEWKKAQKKFSKSNV